MARLVVTYFEDDSEAERMVGYMRNNNMVGEPIAMYKFPTQFCECPTEVRIAKNRGRYANEAVTARGKRFGFRVYRCCGKPLKTTPQYPRNLLLDTSFLGNLLVSFTPQTDDERWTLKFMTERDEKRSK